MPIQPADVLGALKWLIPEVRKRFSQHHIFTCQYVVQKSTHALFCNS